MSRIKYPRTCHLPWSPGATSDDKWISDGGLDDLRSGRTIVVTEKMDGGNVTFYRDGIHARSIDSLPHWETRAVQIWRSLRFEIPDGWRISVESLDVQRSVPYYDLPHHLMVIGVWDETNSLLNWSDTEIVSEAIGLPTVPVLYEGNDFDRAHEAWLNSSRVRRGDSSEGYVVRVRDVIPFDSFSDSVAKWVRANHVTTSSSAWRHRTDWPTNIVIDKPL